MSGTDKGRQFVLSGHAEVVEEAMQVGSYLQLRCCVMLLVVDATACCHCIATPLYGALAMCFALHPRYPFATPNPDLSNNPKPSTQNSCSCWHVRLNRCCDSCCGPWWSVEIQWQFGSCIRQVCASVMFGRGCCRTACAIGVCERDGEGSGDEGEDSVGICVGPMRYPVLNHSL
eukprot:2373595-Rhodomonas_salina.3